MKVVSIIIAAAAIFIILLRLMPRGWAGVERDNGKGLGQLGEEHLHVPLRREL